LCKVKVKVNIISIFNNNPNHHNSTIITTIIIKIEDIISHNITAVSIVTLTIMIIKATILIKTILRTNHSHHTTSPVPNIITTLIAQSITLP
jgi:hypothetical protein